MQPPYWGCFIRLRKMLKYIIKSVYLPKMVSLKWRCRELSQIPIEWRVIDMNIHSHLNVPGDPCDSLSLIVRESQESPGTLREAMYICVNDPSLNRNLESSSSHPYGMKFYRTDLHSSSYNIALLHPLHGSKPP